ncbi:MAG TPA: NAD(P)H-hydrate dehydratase [Syntrophomonadaceae bacterium]|jgi:NAD(P)H-hydrate repair Nnr-like enzyme with NAD(P)H-hydrate dehydratase domain|nr:NAD(P)H-hydrate dehydratase [Syntrophomonadaceae bacterium]
MLIIAGIVPVAEIPLITGSVQMKDDSIVVDGHRIPWSQGTAAMIAAALATTDYLGLEAPRAILAGDTGAGRGSRTLYKYLIDNVAAIHPKVLALHYWMPDLELMHQLYEKVDRLQPRPILIADAASMYAAKAAGLASGFDVFTPDCSELAFLADADAFHPAYIAKHLFEMDSDRNPELIETAFKLKGAARILLVKGPRDLIADETGILEVIDGPDIPAMECIGGTGDSITGMCSALLFGGMNAVQAAAISAGANRIAGQLAAVTPASSISSVVKQIPKALAQVLGEQP